MADGARDAEPFVRNIGKCYVRTNDRLEKHVKEMCELVFQVESEFRRPNQIISHEDKLFLQTQFRKIFWALKLHMVKHFDDEAAENLSQLQEVGRQLAGLTDEQIKNGPHEACAIIDPVSVLMEIVSPHFLILMTFKFTVCRS